jgi:hypothetical protein
VPDVAPSSIVSVVPLAIDSLTFPQSHFVQPPIDRCTCLKYSSSPTTLSTIDGSLVIPNLLLTVPPLVLVSNHIYASQGNVMSRASECQHPWVSNLFDDFKQGAGMFNGSPHLKASSTSSLRSMASAQVQSEGTTPFPAGLQYPVVCSGVCRSTTNMRIVDLERRIKIRLTQLVAKYAPRYRHCLISGVDFIIACTFDTNVAEFYRVEDAKGAHGRYPSIQRFASLQARTLDGTLPSLPFSDVYVTSARRAYCAPAHTPCSPWSSAQLGDTITCTQNILSSRFATDEPSVVIHVLTCSRVLRERWDEWKITGVLDSVVLPSLQQLYAGALVPFDLALQEEELIQDDAMADGFGDAPSFIHNPGGDKAAPPTLSDGLEDDLFEIMAAEEADARD